MHSMTQSPPIVRHTARGLLLAACLFGASASGEPGFSFTTMLERLLPKHDVQVITVTDTTDWGKALPPVSPAQPAYYVAVNLGFGDFGGAVAGIKPPPTQAMNRTIIKVLARQGYLPASDAHPPTQIICWTWGTMNTDYFDIDGPQLNLTQKLRFMGGRKSGLLRSDRAGYPEELETGLAYFDANAHTLLDAASEDLYISALSGYDFAALRRGERRLLWTTKISCPSLGLDLGETLPTMLAIAGPYIGRETDKPVWINATDKYKPDIRIGDPQVVEMLEADKPQVIDVSGQTTKPKTRAKKR